MAQIFEAIMIVAFGVSWPINLYKTVKNKGAEGKSLLFLLFIDLGYVSGITGKIVARNITWVVAFYLLNFAMVTLDLILCLVFKRKKKADPVVSDTDRNG